MQVPGCGKDGVDNRVLGILGAHQEDVLCGDNQRGLTLRSVMTVLRTENGLTQLIEVCIDAVDAGNGAQEPGLEERGPLVHQAPVASHVVLHTKARSNIP